LYVFAAATDNGCRSRGQHCCYRQESFDIDAHLRSPPKVAANGPSGHACGSTLFYVALFTRIPSIRPRLEGARMENR
jgi:hypothetical protein